VVRVVSRKVGDKFFPELLVFNAKAGCTYSNHHDLKQGWPNSLNIEAAYENFQPFHSRRQMSIVGTGVLKSFGNTTTFVILVRY
jgi:hypothetical protein